MSERYENSIGHQLQLAARLHRARISEAIQDLGLFPGQETLILALEAEEKMSVGDLARHLKVRPPTISKTLQRLAQQGLILREESDTGGRRALLRLSGKGQHCATDLATRLKQVDDEISDRLDAKDQRRLRKLLKRAAKALAVAEPTKFVDDDEQSDEDND